jgi:serine/threonine-protein kinase
VIGLRVNNYELVSLVGKGGMGSVYLAAHVTLKRRAAVKVMRPEFAADPELVARFQNEALAATAVGHPGIVDVTDVGTLPASGVPYMMMEYLDGESLAERLGRTATLPIADAVAIARQAAAALHAAHGAGLVHRDLKPENLFLIADGAGGVRVKVLDFGIAKLHPGVGGAEVDTRPGVVLGTPHYMAPEQCRGQQREIGPHTDVYALGVILYQMVSGALPFTGESATDIMIQHVSRDLPAPSLRNPAVGHALESTILRAAARRPQDRFPSMAALGEALQRADAGVAPTSTTASARGRVGRRWVWMAAGVAAAAIAGALVGRARWLARTTPVVRVATPPQAVHPPVAPPPAPAETPAPASPPPAASAETPASRPRHERARRDHAAKQAPAQPAPQPAPPAPAPPSRRAGKF